MKFWKVALVGVLVVAGVFYWLLSRQEAQAKQTARLQAPPPVTVAVAAVQPQTLAPTTEYVGQTQALREVQMTATTQGIVQQVYVQLNGTVRAGQPLLRVDAAQNQASLQAAQEALRKAELDLQRQEQLLAENNAPRADVEAARLQARNAAVQVFTLQKQLREAVVRAPITGQISEKTIEPGMFIAPGTQLLTLTDVAAVKVVLQVPEAELREWQPGRRLHVHFEAYPDAPFTGTVHHIGLKGGEGGRFPVELRVPNTRSATPLRVGLTARVRLTADATTQLTIPRTALLAQQHEPAVFVLQGKRVQQRRVQLDPSFGPQIAVQSGLQAGEQVVVSGTATLRDGQTVEVAKP